MTCPPENGSPISRLYRDLLWTIFSLNTSWDPTDTGILSPLTTARRCSQVCSLWREIILQSSSIWGNSIDLDLLGQEQSYWRDEVLRRTGDALLRVRARNAIVPPAAVYGFLIDLIYGCWERIQIFEVDVGSEQTLNDARVWNAFSRPAANLEVFSISAAGIPRPHNQSSVKPPTEFCLFANIAPILSRFSLNGGHFWLLYSVGMRSLQPLLRTTRLQYLSLNGPMRLSASNLLLACDQMMFLEDLKIAVEIVVRDDPSNPFCSSLQRRAIVPRLRTIDISAPYAFLPAFLGRIVSRPGCTLNANAILQGRQSETVTASSIQAALQVFSIFSHGVFDYSRNEPQLTVTAINISISSHSVCIGFNNEQHSVAVIEPSRYQLPSDILDFILASISNFNFPNTIVQLSLLATPFIPRLFDPTLSKLCLALGTITQLCITPIFFDVLLRVSQSEAFAETLGSKFSVPFPLLKSLEIHTIETGHLKYGVENMQPFLAHRQSIAAIEFLDFGQHRGAYGDLRDLDDLIGLKIIWRQDGQLFEYICGSGNPEALILSQRK